VCASWVLEARCPLEEEFAGIHGLTAEAMRHAGAVDEVRREGDGELCGHVERRDGRWCAPTVFGTVLGTHETSDAAEQHVREDGLASLAERWTLRHVASGAASTPDVIDGTRTGGWRAVCAGTLLP